MKFTPITEGHRIMNEKNKASSNYLRGRVAYLVTSNIHKFQEARRVLSKYKIATAMLRVEAVEIQDDNPENIAKASAIDAVKKCHLPIIVEDAGLHIYALNGFPGPYSSYIFRTIGTKGILKLMKDVEKRNASFDSVIVFHSPERKSPKCFHEKVKGEIAKKRRGFKGFGFDPIFLPREGGGKNFAEMSTTEKNIYSHRAKALRKFAEWYVPRF